MYWHSAICSVLLPGIRISFMVLNDELTKLYNQNKYKFAQTASLKIPIPCTKLLSGNDTVWSLSKSEAKMLNKTPTPAPITILSGEAVTFLFSLIYFETAHLKSYSPCA